MKNIINNIKFFLRADFKKELRHSREDTNRLREELFELRNKILFHDIVHYYQKYPSAEYEKELEYLEKYGIDNAFPYEQIKKIDKPTTSFDEKQQLPYVVHKGKNLYFPADWDLQSVEKAYTNYIERENLLGGGYAAKSPHQYETEKFRVEKGDIVLDIGAAEALFSLDVIDRAKHIYVFEADKQWIKPLYATFKPYKDKVTIINKLVSDKDTETEIQLETGINISKQDTLFIKMDIEGFELLVLNNSRNFLQKQQNIKMAVCTYHKQKDAEKIKSLFDELGFQSEFSEGNILFIYDKEELRPPYFRKGLLRAQKFNYAT